jgi:hypothetical protein
MYGYCSQNVKLWPSAANLRISELNLRHDVAIRILHENLTTIFVAVLYCSITNILRLLIMYCTYVHSCTYCTARTYTHVLIVLHIRTLMYLLYCTNVHSCTYCTARTYTHVLIVLYLCTLRYLLYLHTNASRLQKIKKEVNEHKEKEETTLTELKT